MRISRTNLAFIPWYIIPVISFWFLGNRIVWGYNETETLIFGVIMSICGLFSFMVYYDKMGTILRQLGIEVYD